jgi:antitoxin component of MazEF toxin-antitoxin module
MTKQGADTIPAVILRALALEISLRLSLGVGSVDLVLELKEVRMRCFELS